MDQKSENKRRRKWHIKLLWLFLLQIQAKMAGCVTSKSTKRASGTESSFRSDKDYRTSFPVFFIIAFMQPLDWVNWRYFKRWWQIYSCDLKLQHIYRFKFDLGILFRSKNPSYEGRSFVLGTRKLSHRCYITSGLQDGHDL